MRILMLESHPGVANAAVAKLTEAGCTIVRCDTADRRSPCRGLAAGGECPLDEHVDVAVLVQEVGTHHLEHGAVCAARSRVPVVEVDGVDVAERFPIRSWTSASASSDLIDACEKAARDGRGHAEVVKDRLVVLGVVTLAELEEPAGMVAIAVERGANRLRMTIELADSMRDRQTEIVRAASQALRDFDRRPAVIDIAVRSA
jgi:hypothetical protein